MLFRREGHMADSTIDRRPGTPEWPDMRDDGVYRADTEYHTGRGVAREGGPQTVEAPSQAARVPGTARRRYGKADARGARQPERRWSHGRSAVFAALWVAGAAVLAALSVAAHT